MTDHLYPLMVLSAEKTKLAIAAMDAGNHELHIRYSMEAKAIVEELGWNWMEFIAELGNSALR